MVAERYRIMGISATQGGPITHSPRTWRTLPCMGRGAKVPALRRLRTTMALTQAELAAKAGVQRNTVARLEAQVTTKHADLSTIRKLAAALDVEPAALMVE